MSWHIPPVTDPDIPALDILEIILGHGRSSRLYTRLKMNSNLVREISATAYTRIHTGVFSVEFTMGTENVDDVIKSVADEINRVRTEPVDESELNRARRISEAGYLSAMETMKGQAGTLAFFEVMTGDMNHTEEYLKQLRSVTAADIKKAANRYLKPGNLSIGLMAPEGVEISLPMDMIVRTFGLKSGDNKEENGTISGEVDQAGSMVTLPNGIRLIIKENHRLPIVSIRAALLGGTRLEPPEYSGISGFTAKMLTRGTKKLSASEIASVVESMAGELNGFSGRNSIGLSAKFLKNDLQQGLELLADVLINPSFPKTEAAKVRSDILSDIKSKRENPLQQLTDLFNKTLYKMHPYGRSVTGTEESINSMTISDIKKWYESIAVPSNLVISVVGDVSKYQLLETVKGLFKDFDSTTFSLRDIPPEPPLTKERTVHLERPGKQVHIMIGYLGVGVNNLYNAPMSIIDTALSGKGGRLFVELRNKMSLAYSVSSFRRPGLETGLFGIYLACDPEKFHTARDAIFREIEKLRQDGLSRKEMEDAKSYILGREAIGYQTNGSQAMGMALDELYGLGYDHRQKMLREIKSVTLDDIKEASRAIFIPDRYVMATVGPLSERFNIFCD